jgi:hypothetical protein
MTKEVSANSARRAFNRYSIPKSCNRVIAHSEEGATMWNLKLDWWDALFVREKLRGERKAAIIDDDDINSGLNLYNTAVLIII